MGESPHWTKQQKVLGKIFLQKCFHLLCTLFEMQPVFVSGSFKFLGENEMACYKDGRQAQSI